MTFKEKYLAGEIEFEEIEENKEILENVLQNAEELEDTDSEKVIN